MARYLACSRRAARAGGGALCVGLPTSPAESGEFTRCAARWLVELVGPVQVPPVGRDAGGGQGRTGDLSLSARLSAPRCAVCALAAGAAVLCAGPPARARDGGVLVAARAPLAAGDGDAGRGGGFHFHAWRADRSDDGRAVEYARDAVVSRRGPVDCTGGARPRRRVGSGRARGGGVVGAAGRRGLLRAAAGLRNAPAADVARARGKRFRGAGHYRRGGRGDGPVEPRGFRYLAHAV